MRKRYSWCSTKRFSYNASTNNNNCKATTGSVRHCRHWTFIGAVQERNSKHTRSLHFRPFLRQSSWFTQLFASSRASNASTSSCSHLYVQLVPLCAYSYICPWRRDAPDASKQLRSLCASLDVAFRNAPSRVEFVHSTSGGSSVTRYRAPVTLNARSLVSHRSGTYIEKETYALKDDSHGFHFGEFLLSLNEQSLSLGFP